MSAEPIWRTSSYSGGNSNCVQVAWRTSSYSGDNGNCVQVAWRTSSYSGTNSNCVQVAFAAENVGVRDSKNSSGPVLAFEAEGWRAFLGTVR